MVWKRSGSRALPLMSRIVFSKGRKYIVADTPGHEQYTCNMVTGASTAQAAVILVNVRNGITQQTKRHSFLVSLLGIKHVILAVNKMDLAEYNQQTFDDLVTEYLEFSSALGFETIVTIPVSAKCGDNVVQKSENMAWYTGKTLLDCLDDLNVDNELSEAPFRYPVQSTLRPNSDFRGYTGFVASGTLKTNQEVFVAKSNQSTKISRIISPSGDIENAVSSQALTLCTSDELDISRGDIIASHLEPPHVADQFQAKLVWFSDTPMVPGRSYILRTIVDETSAAITKLKYQIDINDFSEKAVKELDKNCVGVCNFSTQDTIVFDTYSDNKTTGSFILIDQFTNDTVGAGLIDYPLMRAHNIQWQSLDINKQARSEQKQQKPFVL